jgi:hypothetical protein
MKYKFQYKNTPLQFWQLSMYYMYGSIIGVCNIIFTVAMILLSFKMWSNASNFVKTLLLLACCLFSVIQPIGIYLRAKMQAEGSKEIEIGFDESGIHVKTDIEASDLDWRSIKKVSRKPNMIVIFSTTTHGFILTNKVLGKQHEEFYRYIVSKINKF